MPSQGDPAGAGRPWRRTGEFHGFSGKILLCSLVVYSQWLGGDFSKISGIFLVENFNTSPYVLQA
jgi:hypothetical protein